MIYIFFRNWQLKFTEFIPLGIYLGINNYSNKEHIFGQIINGSVDFNNLNTIKFVFVELIPSISASRLYLWSSSQLAIHKGYINPPTAINNVVKEQRERERERKSSGHQFRQINTETSRFSPRLHPLSKELAPTRFSSDLLTQCFSQIPEKE